MNFCRAEADIPDARRNVPSPYSSAFGLGLRTLQRIDAHVWIKCLREIYRLIFFRENVVEMNASKTASANFETLNESL